MKLDEVLRRHKGKWALMSRKNPKKVLQYYHGSGHPSKEWVSKVERRIHSFTESSLDFQQGKEGPKKKLSIRKFMDIFMIKYSHLLALAILHYRPHFKLRARVGWRSEGDDEFLVIDHIYTVGPSGKAYDARGRFDNEKQLLNWYWRPEYTVAKIIDLTVNEIHSMIQSSLLKGFDDSQFETAKAYIEKANLFKRDGQPEGVGKQHIMHPLYGWTEKDFPEDLRENKFKFPLTTKQQVIDYFVSKGRPAGVGAAAWERGWREPKNRNKFRPSVPPRPHWMDRQDDDN